MTPRPSRGQLSTVWPALPPRGSALVYLLLALLALVAALVYVPPVFSRFDAGAARARSADNLLQWGIALNLYLADNNDHFPEVGGALPTPDAKNAWYNALPEYLSLDPLTARSPDERPRPGMRSIWVDPFASQREARQNWGEYFFSYGMSYWLQPDPASRPFRVSMLNDPAGIIFMTTTSGPRPGVAPATVMFRAGPTGPAARPNDPAAQAPILFADGHVEWKTRSEIAPPSGASHRKYWLPFEGAPDPNYPGVSIEPLPAD